MGHRDRTTHTKPRSRLGRLALRRGRWGERMAARLLRKAGCQIVGRNVRTPHGEVDVLVLDGSVLTVVEVKCGDAPISVLATRIRYGQRVRLLRAARWLGTHARGRSGGVRWRRVRIDFVFLSTEPSSRTLRAWHWRKNALARPA